MDIVNEFAIAYKSLRDDTASINERKRKLKVIKESVIRELSDRRGDSKEYTIIANNGVQLSLSRVEMKKKLSEDDLSIHINSFIKTHNGLGAHNVDNFFHEVNKTRVVQNKDVLKVNMPKSNKRRRVTENKSTDIDSTGLNDTNNSTGLNGTNVGGVTVDFIV